jgi:hypothetical protein
MKDFNLGDKVKITDPTHHDHGKEAIVSAVYLKNFRANEFCVEFEREKFKAQHDKNKRVYINGHQIEKIKPKKKLFAYAFKEGVQETEGHIVFTKFDASGMMQPNAKVVRAPEYDLEV